MKMEPLNSGELRIWMTSNELARWGLNTDTMQVGEPSTDRALRRLLAVARQRMVFPEGTVTVEALPLEGGCLFLFSGCRQKFWAVAPRVYRLETAEDLLQFAQTLHAAHKSTVLPCASLYRQKQGYLLIVYAGFGPIRRVCRFAEEFGTFVGEGEAVAALIEEHTAAVTVGDALNRLCEAYESPQPVQRHPTR